MGTLLRFYFDDPTLLALARTGMPGLPSVPETPEDHQLGQALRAIVASGIGSSEASACVTIRAFQVLCDRFAARAGEIDHFNYEEEDLPELSALQFGDTSTPLILPVDLDAGLPAVNHWPARDLAALAKSLRDRPVDRRPPYCRGIHTDLSNWVNGAIERDRGLLVFSE